MALAREIKGIARTVGMEASLLLCGAPSATITCQNEDDPFLLRSTTKYLTCRAIIAGNQRSSFIASASIAMNAAIA